MSNTFGQNQARKLNYTSEQIAQHTRRLRPQPIHTGSKLKPPTLLITRNQTKLRNKENSKSHAEQSINNSQKYSGIVGIKRKNISINTKPNTLKNVTNAQLPKKLQEKQQNKLGLISAAISRKKFSAEPEHEIHADKIQIHSDSLDAEQANRASLGTASASHCGPSGLSNQEACSSAGVNPEKPSKRQKIDHRECTSSGGLTSVSSIAQNFIPSWLQSISSSITNTFNGIQENLMYNPRITLEPSIPNDQKLASSLGFTGVNALQSLQKQTKKVYQSKLGFQVENISKQIDNQKQLEIIPIKQNFSAPVPFYDYKLDNERLLRHNDRRNDLHCNCDDVLDLQLQNKSSTLLNGGSKKPETDEPVSLQFAVYQDASLSFLDKDTVLGRQVSKSIVQADFDDDCATDEDMRENAQKAMIRELSKGIDKYLQLKRVGHTGKLIKNIDKRGRFTNGKPWDPTEDEK